MCDDKQAMMNATGMAYQSFFNLRDKFENVYDNYVLDLNSENPRIQKSLVLLESLK